MPSGSGITFTPSSFSIEAIAGIVGGSVEYRSPQGTSHSGHTRREPREPNALQDRGPESHRVGNTPGAHWCGSARLRPTPRRRRRPHRAIARAAAADPSAPPASTIQYGLQRNAATSASRSSTAATTAANWFRKSTACRRASGSAAPQPILSRCCRAEVRPGEAASHLQALLVAPAGLADGRKRAA